MIGRLTIGHEDCVPSLHQQADVLLQLFHLPPCHLTHHCHLISDLNTTLLHVLPSKDTTDHDGIFHSFALFFHILQSPVHHFLLLHDLSQGVVKPRNSADQRVLRHLVTQLHHLLFKLFYGRKSLFSFSLSLLHTVLNCCLGKIFFLLYLFKHFPL